MSTQKAQTCSFISTFCHSYTLNIMVFVTKDKFLYLSTYTAFPVRYHEVFTYPRMVKHAINILFEVLSAYYRFSCWAIPDHNLFPKSQHTLKLPYMFNIPSLFSFLHQQHTEHGLICTDFLLNIVHYPSHLVIFTI